ncbi:leukocyte elastase inhibitor-like [Venturia canescens]|uniref:leukocyte elastase inhibitor-like n=1 Tax=Venturia canescens TaxID=32260 RepID=UPI001C9D135C|nr:leukocyte elastase inhibitor-like [Venturia canescens]
MVAPKDEEWTHTDINSKYQEVLWTRSEALEVLTKGLNEFGPVLWQNVVGSELNNRILSPVLVAVSLAMPSFGASADDQSRFNGIVKTPKFKYQARIAYQALVDHLEELRDAGLRVAHGIFMSETTEPRFEFIEATTRAFRSPLKKINFENPYEIAKSINDWITKKTGSKISNVIADVDIERHPCIILASALYFKGTWEQKFNETDPKSQPFHLSSDHEKNVDYMATDGTFLRGYIKAVEADYVVVPYQVNEGKKMIPMKMIFILPKEETGFFKLVDNFHLIAVQKLIPEATESEVHIQLPQFDKLECQEDLKLPLKRLGLGAPFSPCGLSNFNKLVDEEPKLYISQAVHTAVFEIDSIGVKDPPSPPATGPGVFQFIANRPFYAVLLGEINEDYVNILTIRYCGPN